MKLLLILIISLSISLIDTKDVKGYGYWLYGIDMKNVDLGNLSKQGTTDIFLNFYAIEAHGENQVVSWIQKAKDLKIRVHIWMQAFYHGDWINPMKADITKIVNEAKKYARMPGVSGVHFDYLRFSGTNNNKANGRTKEINDLVKLAVSAIHSINPKCIVSAALMPEKNDSKDYYGQDYEVISKYMDVVVPMIYKGNYKKTTAWIKETTEWYVKNSKGAAVWAGIQSYKNDDNPTKLSLNELTSDAKAALNGKAKGVIVFRWGITNLLNYISIKK